MSHSQNEPRCDTPTVNPVTNNKFSYCTPPVSPVTPIFVYTPPPGFEDTTNNLQLRRNLEKLYNQMKLYIEILKDSLNIIDSKNGCSKQKCSIIYSIPYETGDETGDKSGDESGDKSGDESDTESDTKSDTESGDKSDTESDTE